MNILSFNNRQELNETAARIITDLVKTNPYSILGLATGSTPIGIYEEIVKRYRNTRISFSGVTTFNLDEYVGLPKNHIENYYNYMQRHLFRHIDISAERSHIPDGNSDDLERECIRYNNLLDRANQIDLQILSLGHNGHIGFNEPDHLLICGTHIVKLSEKTRGANARFFKSVQEVPTHALTVGVDTILKSKNILLVVCGADKAEIVQRVITGPISTQCPGSLLRTHPRVDVLLDIEACRLLA